MDREAKIKAYIVNKLDKFLALSHRGLGDHLERVAERYMESVRLDAHRLVDEAMAEAVLKYPPAGD